MQTKLPKSQLETPEGSSVYKVVPEAEVVMFEKFGLVESQPVPEALSSPSTEPTTIRVVQKGVPFAEIGEASVVPAEVLSAQRAVKVSGVIRDLREGAVESIARQQGLNRAA